MYLAKPPGYNLMNFAQPFLILFIDRLVYSVMQMLTAFQKIGKNTRGRLELLTSIYHSCKNDLHIIL